MLMNTNIFNDKINKKTELYPFLSWLKKPWRTICMMIMDGVLLCLAAFLALVVRFEFSLTEPVAQGFFYPILFRMPFFVAGALVIFTAFHMYSGMWEFAGTEEFIRLFEACGLSALLLLAILMFSQCPFPRSFPVFTLAFELIFVTLSRYAAYLSHKRRQRGGVRTMLIGGGEAGAMIIQECQRSRFSQNNIVCVIDDDPAKRGQYLRGVRIIGGRDKILQAAKQFDINEILFCIPTASSQEKKHLLTICQETGCRLRTLPALYQIANGEVIMQTIRNVEIEDLLGREPVQVDLEHIGAFLNGKTVLVTGGGGSIGSELCRQIAHHAVKQLIIFDIYENNAYGIQQELRRSCPELPLETLIGSVRDKERVRQIFERYRPQIVFHAAAHKHVPLMEDSPNEAVKNNIFGTYNVACMAGEYGVETFVLISSDKAVNPTNVMGASKRMCEMIVQSLNDRYDTKYVAVRFGNVLGSNGSIIPLFRQQIAQGGPVTVTDKRVIRYFMTIPEAVSLVMLAGSDARGGEIFILDMGEPVKIDDLARNMIRLSGLEPGVDIEIVYTGLRPGEKLYEELLIKEEGLRSTDNKLIFIGKPLNICPEDLQKQLEVLWKACMHNSPDIKTLLEQDVPTYHITDNRPA